MVMLMTKNDNKRNTDSFTADFSKNVTEQVISKRIQILETVGDSSPELLEEMTNALDLPFQNHMGRCIGKYHRVKWLVDIWMVFKCVDALLNETGGARVTSLKTFIDLMNRFNQLSVNAVEANTEK